MIQRNARGHDIAPGIWRRKLDPEPLSFGVDNPTEERLDGLYFYQRYFAPAVAGFG
jgi:hypothetical protein